MRSFTRTKSPLGLLVAIVILASPLSAQQKRTAPPPKKPASAVVPEPAPTFDTLLSNETYKVYCELRGVGALIRSSAVQDLLEPVMKLAAPPKEFKTVVKWLNAHADALAGSRMFVASWPSTLNIPNVVMAIEFSSAEEAQKFERELRGFIPTLLPKPTPAPITSSSGKPNAPGPTPGEKESEPALPPYHIKQTGTLVLIADKPIEFRKLRSRGSKFLEEDPNFALARNRFASESLFLYFDFKSIEKEEKDRRQKWEEEEQKRTESLATSPKAEGSPGDTNSQLTVQSSLEVSTPEPPPQGAPIPPGSPQTTLGTTASNNAGSRDATVSTAPDSDSDKEAAEMSGAFYSLSSILFGGQPNWPEAVAAGVVFEGDAYVVRTLVVDGAEHNPGAVPFVPQFISGPALVPQAASIFPADTALFVTASLDYPQIYEGMVKAIASAEESARKYRRRAGGNPDYSQPASPFAIYEKKLGIKIKDDLLPLLGNELALALPRATPVASESNPGPQATEEEKSGQKNASQSEPNPVIAVAIKDKEAVRRLIPKLIESLAFKGANLFAQTEKREETEITSYANVLSYAFIGDFLVLSTDAAATRHVVDFYLSRQTLSSDSHFRNSTRWQPRQVLGSVYVAPDIMQRYFPGGSGAPASEKLKEFLLRLNPEIEPMTYALSNEGLGPLHELHVPKSLLMLMIAGMSSQVSQTPLITNEAVAKSMMRTVVSAEAMFQATNDAGRYGTLDELLTAGLISKEAIQKYGYKIEVTVSSNKFEATAVPVEYGITGRLSYFVDDSGVIRGGDHGGGAATIADREIQ